MYIFPQIGKAIENVFFKFALTSLQKVQRLGSCFQNLVKFLSWGMGIYKIRRKTITTYRMINTYKIHS